VRLPLFDIIDATIDRLNADRALYDEVANQLRIYFNNALCEHKECLLNASTRVKSPDSLREKMLRKNLYKLSADPQVILNHLSDIVGIRLQCRFMAEEQRVYRAVCEYAHERDDEGYFYNPDAPMVRLELASPQPQTQANGFSIYRIDGVYLIYGRMVRFELQIKALVHAFWAEIEHEVIYKNNSYVLLDKFMKEMLTLSYNNLTLVDSQLYTIYRQMQIQSASRESSLRSGMVYSVLAKGISDLFFSKMRASLGLTLNCRDVCDVLSRYVLLRYQRLIPNGDVITNIFQRLNHLIEMPMDFKSPLALETEYQTDIPFCRILADYWLSVINKDYDWNLFFRMLFALEPGSNADDFGTFLKMMYDRFTRDSLYAPLKGLLCEADEQRFREEVLEHLARSMVKRGDTSMLYWDQLKEYEHRIRSMVEHLAREEERNRKDFRIPENAFD
jgi:ppGpp synthetase/RelA/SpoT-type nucleotidyltranferase